MVRIRRGLTQREAAAALFSRCSGGLVLLGLPQRKRKKQKWEASAMGADMNFTMTINGKAVTGAEKFGVENPALGEVFAEAPNCTQAELDEAVAAARAALPA